MNIAQQPPRCFSRYGITIDCAKCFVKGSCIETTAGIARKERGITYEEQVSAYADKIDEYKNAIEEYKEKCLHDGTRTQKAAGGLGAPYLRDDQVAVVLSKGDNLYEEMLRRTPKPDQSDGSTASYYELPEGATELQHLISHRNLNAQLGEIFRACYRYGLVSHSPMKRDIKKIIFYAQAELERLEALEKKHENAK
jgi:hypothetical protein